MVSSNPPLLDYGVNDITYESILPNMSSLHSPRWCLDQEENVVLEDSNPSSNNEIN